MIGHTRVTAISPIIIQNYKQYIGYIINENELLSRLFTKSMSTGFHSDKDENFIVNAKLGDMQQKNEELIDGTIIVHPGLWSFGKLDQLLENNLKEHIPLSVIAKEKDENQHLKYIFKGYYYFCNKGQGKHKYKYLIKPLDALPNDSKQKYLQNMNLLQPKSKTSTTFLKEKNLYQYNFVVKSKNENYNQLDQILAHRDFFNGNRFDSKLEASYAKFFAFLNIPYITQFQTGVLETNGNQSFQYNIDFLIFPEDEERKSFIEIKHRRPTLKEEELCQKVSYKNPGIPVYLCYGNLNIPFSVHTNHIPNGYSCIKYMYNNQSFKMEEGFAFCERNHKIVIDKRESPCDMSFFTSKLQRAYQVVAAPTKMYEN